MNITEKIAAVLNELCPNSEYIIRHDKIEWIAERDAIPTEEEINAKIAEFQADYDALQYQRDRAEAYPSIADQLDKIYHSGIDAWKKDIKAVKDKFPKPE